MYLSKNSSFGDGELPSHPHLGVPQRAQAAGPWPALGLEFVVGKEIRQNRLFRGTSKKFLHAPLPSSTAHTAAFTQASHV